GEVVGAIGPLAQAHRAHEIGLAPAADPGVGMRRDVGAVERAERRLERPATGVRLRARLRLGMAADAAACLGEIQAALDVTLRVALRKRDAECHGKQEPDGPCASRAPRPLAAEFYCFWRNVSWQPPQALPTAPICALTLAS